MPTYSQTDHNMMTRALQLAKKGEGYVEPNPMVGCVLTKRGNIIGEGYHRRFGGPHAEVVALSRCKENPRGSTAYVTLEPCCIHGKTPPCTDALIEAGVTSVVAAIRDPNQAVRSRGFARLRRAGCKVSIGLLADEAAELIAPFATRMLLKRPYVIAKWAQSLDGKIATRTGDSKWISSTASRKMVHRLRSRVDAILVGSATVLADNPKLTARDTTLRRQALRVVLDGRLRTPKDCALVRSAKRIPVLVITTTQQRESRSANQLRKAGVIVEGVRTVKGVHTKDKRLSLSHVMKLLFDRNVTNLLVEGGSAMLGSFFDSHLVDEAWVFVAPKIIGGTDATTAIGGVGVNRVVNGQTIRSLSTKNIGPDILYRLTFAQPLRTTQSLC